MRPKVTEPSEIGESSQSQKCSTNVTEMSDSKVLLKSVCTINYADEISAPFCLQALDKYLIVRAKTKVDVAKFESTPINHQNKFQMTSTIKECSKKLAYDCLQVDEEKIMEGASHQEKCEIMMNPFLLPHCTLKNIYYLKCLVSPSTSNLGPIIACLTTHGALELLQLKSDDNGVAHLEALADLCEIRAASMDISKKITKLNYLQEKIHEVTIDNFEWCPKIINNTYRFIVVSTKKSQLLFYCIRNVKESETEIVLRHAEDLNEISISQLKWVSTKQNHYLFVSTTNGDLVRFRVILEWDGKWKEIQKLDMIQGSLDISISNITHESVGESMLLVCAKEHSIEAFHIDGTKVRRIKKYIGLSITGVTSCGPYEFLIATLNTKIFNVKFSTAIDELKIDYCNKIEFSSNDVSPSKYATYGITASHNRVLFFLALHPRAVIDHLVIKQPCCVAVCTYSKNDPYQLLIQNPSNQLTNYYDCIEVVRYMGTKKLESLKVLEEMNYEISLSLKFLYYLKVQLMVVNAKIVYYQLRSDSISDLTKESQKSIMKVIDVIRAYFLLKQIVSKKSKQTEQIQLQAIRCLANHLQTYLDDVILNMPFKNAQEMFRPHLKALIDECEFANAAPPEICVYCNDPIEKTQFTCQSNHEMKRCAITKLQLPIDSTTFCQQCQNGVVDKETLTLVTNNNKQMMLCVFCDRFMYP